MSTSRAHPLMIRLTHWVGAYAMGCMILSGWQIYNASPLLPFRFPPALTLGGWLGGALAWHFGAMWLLIVDGGVYMLYGLLSGHFRRDLWPVTARAVATDLWAALTLRLRHQAGAYNAVQKLMYLLVLVGVVLMAISGLALWKPVQFVGLTDALGGYEVARRIHFALMSCIVAFLAVHLALVALVPSTLWGMIAGRK
jgi:thiosulfate reductase cytochrome b subunit